MRKLKISLRIFRIIFHKNNVARPARETTPRTSLRGKCLQCDCKTDFWCSCNSDGTQSIALIKLLSVILDFKCCCTKIKQDILAYEQAEVVIEAECERKLMPRIEDECFEIPETSARIFLINFLKTGIIPPPSFIKWFR